MENTFQKEFYVFETVTSDLIDTSGYATISNSGTLGEFDGTTVPAIATQSDYELDITVDSTLYKLATISINVADDWDDIATAIETALQAATSSTETVAIDASGNIKITSATNGSASAILIAAGTAGTGSGDLLGVIDAIGATYVTTLDTPVDGVEGAVELVIDSSSTPTTNYKFMPSVKTSAGLEKTGLVYTYADGILTVADNGSTTELAVGDEILVGCIVIPS